MKRFLILCLLAFPAITFCQNTLSPLSVEKIMRDPKWIGTSPSSTFWDADGEKLYFLWNPDKSPDDSLYFITIKDHTPRKVSFKEKNKIEKSFKNRNGAKKCTFCLFIPEARGGEPPIVEVQFRLGNSLFKCDSDLVKAPRIGEDITKINPKKMRKTFNLSCKFLIYYVVLYSILLCCVVLCWW